MPRILFFSFLLVTSGSYAQQPFSFGGYLKYINQFSFIDNLDDVSSLNLLHNRLNFRLKPSKPVTAAMEVRTRVFYGGFGNDHETFSSQLDDRDELVDMSVKIIDRNGMIMLTGIDRLWLSYTAGKLTLRAGRQRINWGINIVWNPNDIFNAYNFLDFDYEEMPGVDAFMLTYYTGLFSNLELAVKPSKEKDNTIAALKYSLNRWNYDLQFIAGIYQKDVVLGSGWAGNIFDAGFKGEASYFFPYGGMKGTFAASPGIDYYFKNGIYVNCSYLFNSAGTNDINRIYEIAYVKLSPKNLMPFRHNIFAQASYLFAPMVNGNLSLIFSPAVNSLIIFPYFSFSLSSNWDLDLLAQSFLGKTDDKYSSLSNHLYLRIRWSF